MEVALVVLAFLFVVTNVLAYEEGKIVGSETDRASDPNPTATVDHDWLRAWYAAAHSDIRWAKERSWIAVSWAVVLYPALAGAYVKRLFGELGSESFAVFTIAIAVWEWWYLISLHRFAAEARDTTYKIRKKVPGHSRFLLDRGRDPNHLWILVLQIALVTILAAATLYALITVHSAASPPISFR